MRFRERFVSPTRPCRRNHLNGSIAKSHHGHLTELYTPRMTPMRQEVSAHREADVLAEKAQPVREEAFDLFPQVDRRAESRHDEVRLRCSAYRALCGVNQEEPPCDETVHGTAWSAQLLKDVKQPSAQVIRWVRVEVTAVLGWGDTNEKNTDRVWRFDALWVQQARRTFDADVREVRSAAGTPLHVHLKQRPAILHEPYLAGLAVRRTTIMQNCLIHEMLWGIAV